MTTNTAPAAAPMTDADMEAMRKLGDILGQLAVKYMVAGSTIEEAADLALEEYRASLAKLRRLMADPEERARYTRAISDQLWTELRAKAGV